MAETNTTSNDAALEILKRLEPAIAGLVNRGTAIEGRLTVIEGRLTNVETRLGTVENRLSGIEGQLKNMPHSMVIIITILVAVIGNGVVMAGIMLTALNYARSVQ